MAARPERSTAKPKKKAPKAASNGAATPKAAAKAPPAKPKAPPPKGSSARPEARPQAPKATKAPSTKSAPVKGISRPSPRPLPKIARSTPRTNPPPPPPKPRSIEERAADVETRLARASEQFRRDYQERFDMTWIFHDSALEGVVYTPQELRAALDPGTTVVPDSSLQPICDDIRRHREAIAYCRDFATKKRQPVTTDVIKKIYLILHPEEGDLKSVKYRKEIPQHRLYFHEYAGPDKIGSKVRQVVEWVNDPETRKVRGPIRIAGRAHYDLLRAFPFPTDSGRVARLFMNLLLLRSGYPPGIILSTERQRYYEALKGSAATINSMIQESIENALASIEKLLDEYETRTRSFY